MVTSTTNIYGLLDKVLKVRVYSIPIDFCLKNDKYAF